MMPSVKSSFLRRKTRGCPRRIVCLARRDLPPSTFENIPLHDVSEEDFDDGLLWSFANAFEDNAVNTYLYHTSDFLRKDLLLAVGNADEFFPTVAAVLLFAKNERVAQLLPRSATTLARFSGDNGHAQLIEKIEINGNLHSQYEAILSFINRYVDLRKEKPKKKLKLVTDGGKVVQPRGDYHHYSILEAVVNLLIHRDLGLRDITTRINIYDNSIEFINPRRTSGFVPPAGRAIRYGISQSLNPQIGVVLRVANTA